MHRWYTRDWMQYLAVKDNYHTGYPDVNATTYQTQVSAVHDALEAAVQRQLMSDVPYGVLLSGGLDSSVISAIAKKYAGKRIETDNKADAWWPQLHSFAVGLKGAPDLIKAREVAQYIGTIHHEINYTIQEGLDAIRDVIYFIETYDVTTVRASTPMYLLARVIKSMGIKHENALLVDREGVIYEGRTTGMNQWKSAHAVKTSKRTLAEALAAPPNLIDELLADLTRVALTKGSLVVNSSQGGGTKDTWVLED
jgi:hypothetical protein